MTSKIKFYLLVSAFMILLSCQTSQLNNTYALEPGIFKVAILYPNGEDRTFDMDYYENTHMPMVAGFLGENLKLYEIDMGIAGRKPDDKVPFVAIGYFYVYNVAEYNKAITQHRDTIIGDFKNYTNIQPVVQISEIKQVEFKAENLKEKN